MMLCLAHHENVTSLFPAGTSDGPNKETIGSGDVDL